MSVAADAKPGGAASQAATSSRSSPAKDAVRAGDLAITVFTLCESKQGLPRADKPYKPSDTVYTKYELANFGVSSDHKVDVKIEMRITDPQGVPLKKPWEDHISGTVSGASRECSGYFNVDLPGFVQAGDYRITMTATDSNRKKTVEKAVVFRVQAARIEPADHLEIRDFALGPSKDRPASEKVVMPAGSTLYMSAKVFGAKFKADRCDLQIDLQMVGPDGSVLTGKTGWITCTDEFLYHPRVWFLPITGKFSLPSSLDKGTYIQTYKVIDKVAGNSVEHTVEFEVR